MNIFVIFRRVHEKLLHHKLRLSSGFCEEIRIVITSVFMKIIIAIRNTITVLSSSIMRTVELLCMVAMTT